MRRARMLGVCALVACAVSAGAASGASAAAPEFGRCVKTAKGFTGAGFSSSDCINSVAEDAKYEWISGPGPLPAFTTTARYIPGPITKHCINAKRDETQAAKKIEEAVKDEEAASKAEEEGDLPLAESLRAKAAKLRKEAAELEAKAKTQRKDSGISKEECEKLIEEESEAEEPVVLEEESGLAVECSSLSGSGEYTSASEVGNVKIKFTGCEVAETEIKCQSEGAKTGEILPVTLHGVLGWDKHEGSPNKSKVGIALSAQSGSSTVAEFTCGPFAIKVTGSVIHDVTTDKMILSETEKFVQHGGEQTPERFEGEPLDVLSVHIGESSDQAGMGLLSKLTNEEKIEVNAAV